MEIKRFCGYALQSLSDEKFSVFRHFR